MRAAILHEHKVRVVRVEARTPLVVGETAGVAAVRALALGVAAGGTALLGGAALLMDSSRGGGPATTDAASSLVPDLAQRADDVNRIELVSGSGTLTLGRTESGWGLAARGGYPVEADKVRTLLAAYARAERLEPKTKNPDRYPDLGLADVDADFILVRRARPGAGPRDDAVVVDREGARVEFPLRVDLVSRALEHRLGDDPLRARRAVGGGGDAVTIPARVELGGIRHRATRRGVRNPSRPY